jgi:hypothetical protein
MGWGRFRATVILGLALAGLLMGFVWVASLFWNFSVLANQAAAQELYVRGLQAVDEARSDLAELGAAAERFARRNGRPPADTEELYEAWEHMAAPGQYEPQDPYDGNSYGYAVRGADFVVWSVGSDGVGGSPDDLAYDSRVGAVITGRAGELPRPRP